MVGRADKENDGVADGKVVEGFVVGAAEGTSGPSPSHINVH